MALTPYSWKIVTTANCTFAMPFECPPVGIWCDTPGVAKTATIEGIWPGGAALPLNSEIWVEVEYLQSGASPLAGFANDGPADLLEAGVAQTASGVTWSGPPAVTTFDGTNTLAVALSNGNLTVTHNSTSFNAGVKSTSFLATGKYYFETQIQVSTTANNASGIITPGGSMTDPAVAGTNCFTCLFSLTSTIFSNGVTTGIALGNAAINDVFGFAIDFDARLGWVRRNANNWNNSGTANPATGVGGAAVMAGSLAPFARFTNGPAIDAMTSNFGQSAYANAMPAGFSNWDTGWKRFKLSVPFTAQQPGFIYARVKCAKPSATFYIDPKLVLS